MKTEKIFVTYRIEGRYTAEVEAGSLEEARKKAEEAYYNADFGELHDVGDCNTEQIYATDANGNFVWEK